MTRRCCDCKQDYEHATKSKTYRCSPCRSIYDKKWRERRKAEGLPTSFGWDPPTGCTEPSWFMNRKAFRGSLWAIAKAAAA